MTEGVRRAFDETIQPNYFQDSWGETQLRIAEFRATLDIRLSSLANGHAFSVILLDTVGNGASDQFEVAWPEVQRQKAISIEKWPSEKAMDAAAPNLMNLFRKAAEFGCGNEASIQELCHFKYIRDFFYHVNASPAKRLFCLHADTTCQPITTKCRDK